MVSDAPPLQAAAPAPAPRHRRAPTPPHGDRSRRRPLRRRRPSVCRRPRSLPINPDLPPDQPLEPGSGPPTLRANPARAHRRLGSSRFGGQSAARRHARRKIRFHRRRPPRRPGRGADAERARRRARPNPSRLEDGERAVAARQDDEAGQVAVHRRQHRRRRGRRRSRSPAISSTSARPHGDRDRARSRRRSTHQIGDTDVAAQHRTQAPATIAAVTNPLDAAQAAGDDRAGSDAAEQQSAPPPTARFEPDRAERAVVAEPAAS